jgi:hypothetical protein
MRGATFFLHLVPRFDIFTFECPVNLRHCRPEAGPLDLPPKGLYTEKHHLEFNTLKQGGSAGVSFAFLLRVQDYQKKDRMN